MTIIQSFLSRLLPFFALLLVVLGCNQGDKETTATGNSSATTTSSSSSGAKTDTSSPDIAGNYDVTGTNEGGRGPYRGSLVVTNRGDVYQFSWDSGGKKYDGVGVQTGNAVGVAFAEGENGRGCGVVLYKIGSDMTLDGKAGYWGNNSSESETATRSRSAGDLDGEYDIKGTNTEGKEYKGTLSVQKSGAGYEFRWKAGVSLDGFGIRQGDTVTVGIGGQKCGFVGYKVEADGTLAGKWGGYGSRSVGTEVAKKR